MPHIKELLISPFSLVPPTNATNAINATNTTTKKAQQRSFQMCKCDSDNEDNDFGMAPDCAFICSFNHISRNKTTKKRKQTQSPRKKTRRTLRQ